MVSDNEMEDRTGYSVFYKFFYSPQMVHGWSTMHVVVTVEHKATGQISYIDTDVRIRFNPWLIGNISLWVSIHRNDGGSVNLVFHFDLLINHLLVRNST